MKTPIPNNRCFEEILLEAVEEVLSSLGLPVKNAVYFYLEKSFGLKRHDIPYKIEKFANAIEEIFGVGAKLLEIQIMKSLYKKVGQKLRYVPKHELNFVRYVKAVRNKYRNLKNKEIEVVYATFLKCAVT